MRWRDAGLLKTILGGVLVSMGAHAFAVPPQTGRPPNVLFIAIDDLRDWVGYLGCAQVKTPNLDKLAARGVAFTRSYCASPCCNPSRAAVMSGLRPGSSGVYGNGDPWHKIIPDDTVTLPVHFRNHGYYVCGAGKIYHGNRESDWDAYGVKGGGGAYNERAAGGIEGIAFGALDCADKDMPDYNTVDYCLDQLNRPHDKPFFIGCGLVKPHMPWSVPRQYYAMYPLDGIQLPKVLDNDLDDVPPAGVAMAKPEGDHAAVLASGRWKEAVQAYLATITFCDTMIGRLMEGLARSPHKDNTIICLWSDHGWHLGEKQHWRKFALWEHAARAPHIWVAPGVTRPGGVCGRTVDYMSIYPTLCDLAGIPVPGHVEGVSIRKLLEAPGAAWETPAITTWMYNNHAIRSEDWRYIRYDNGDEELYHHRVDPLEWTNLANHPEYAAKKAELARWIPTRNVPRVEKDRSHTRAQKERKGRKREAEE